MNSIKILCMIGDKSKKVLIIAQKTKNAQRSFCHGKFEKSAFRLKKVCAWKVVELKLSIHCILQQYSFSKQRFVDFFNETEFKNSSKSIGFGWTLEFVFTF